MPPGEGQADSLVATRLCINMTTGNRGLNMAESELDREQNILAIVEGGFWRGREMGGGVAALFFRYFFSVYFGIFFRFLCSARQQASKQASKQAKQRAYGSFQNP